ncbi:MAG: T9SS type A sorting domain-containing protein [Saprospiraceae bacterium]|nr:T9SS type A sorting domain-containing protein [Saprospiraceae bacterium]
MNSVSNNYFNDVSFNEFDDKYIVLFLAGHSDLLNGGLELNPAQDILNLHIKSNSNTVLSKVISVENELGLVVTKSENLRPVLNFEDVIPTSTTDLYGELAVFPNPASHKLSVAVPDHFTIFNLQVYNLNGNLVKTSYTKGDPTLLVETLPNGFYIIKATSTQGVVKSASFIKL